MGWMDLKVHLEQQKTEGPVQNFATEKRVGRESFAVPTGLLLCRTTETPGKLVFPELLS